MSSLVTITDPTEIAQVMRNYMLEPEKERVPFLAVIELRKPWLIYEGARPLASSSKPDGDTTYTLTNGDSDYTASIGSVELSNIKSIQVMP